jgi:branched-chain amino acid transport system substrate-binding protein
MSKMKKFGASIFVLFLIATLTAGLLTGCSSTKSSTTTTTGATKEATLTIGVDAPLTGPAASYGLAVMHGVKLAAEDFNTAGGLTVGNTHYTIAVNTLDNKWDDPTSTDNVHQFIDNGVKYLFIFESDTPLSLAPLLAQNKVINFTSIADNSSISQPANSFTFRTVIPHDLVAGPYYQWIKTTYPNVKTVCEIAENNANGQSAETGDGTGAQASGITVVGNLLYDPGTTNFTPFLTSVLAKHPDMINISGGVAPGDCALIIKGARDAGFTGLISDSAMVAAKDMLPVSGATALEGVITTNMAMEAPMVSPQAINLPAREVAEFGQSYGVTWDFYGQATVLCEAIAKAKSVDSTTVRDLLTDNTQVWPYPILVGGTAVFGSSIAQQFYGANATHQMLESYVFGVIRNGQDTNFKQINP